MSNKHKHIDQLTPELIRRYRAGELSPEEAHAVEKYLLENPFEAEAMEGLEMLPVDEAEVHLQQLQERIDRRVQPSVVDKGATEFWAYTRRIAAVIMLLLVAGFAYLWLRPAPEGTMTRQMAAKKEELSQKADTLNEKRQANEVEAMPAAPEDEKTAALAVPVDSSSVKTDSDLNWLDSMNLMAAEIPENYEIVEESLDEALQSQTARLEALPVAAPRAALASETIALPTAAPRQADSATLPPRVDSSRHVLYNVQEVADLTTTLQATERARVLPQLIPDANRELPIISGIVKEDATGEILPNVQVKIKGTKTGKSTDVTGQFTLQADTTDAVLVVSFIGYKTVELPLKGKINDLEILLEEEVSSLGEVVVVSDAKREERFTVSKNDKPSGFDAFVAENLVYPKAAQEKGIKGKVTLEVAVDQEGKVGKVSVIRGLGHGCDAEAIRLARAYPGWQPKINKRTGLPEDSKFKVRVRLKPE